jgi:tetratricopeptide (TPR) repeat protein
MSGLRPIRSIWITAAACLLVGALRVSAATLQSLPAIDTAKMEPAVRQQVNEAVAAATAAAHLPPIAAAQSFGQSGKVFLAYNLAEAARACFENAVSLAANDPRWSYYAAVAAQGTGKLEAARDHLKHAASLPNPTPQIFCRAGDVELLLGDLDAAQKDFQVAAKAPETTAAAHVGLGRVALAGGNADLAMTELKAGLAAQPEASAVHALLASAYQRLGKTAEASAEAAAYGNRSVQYLDPLISAVATINNGRLALVRLALKDLTEGRFQQAETGFRQAIELDPSDALAWVNLGTAQENLGNADAAVWSYKRAVELAPDNARARYDLGTILASKGDRAQGIEQLEEAVRLRPAMADARFNLASALAQEDRMLEALTQCTELLAIAPQDQQVRTLCTELRSRAVSHPRP